MSSPTHYNDPCAAMWGDGPEHAEFAAFMRWKPEHLFQDRRGSQSDGTKPSSTFDLHLGDSLVLKRVICLEQLSDRLGNAVDECLHELLEKKQIPPKPDIRDHFPTEAKRRIDAGGTPNVLSYEKGVVNHYTKTTGQWCCTVASTLVIHPKLRKWRPFLDCTLDPHSQSHGAIADIYLTISPQLFQDSDDMTKMIRKSHLKQWAAVHHHFPRLMPFECKSLLSGSYPVMKQIREFANGGVFPWRSCPGCKAHRLSKVERSRDYQVVGRRLLAQEPLPFTPPPCLSETSCPSPKPDDRDISRNNLSRASSIESDHQWDCSRSPTPEPDPVNPNGTPQSDRESARDILQQAWAQAVRLDSTFLVILAGNYEIIGIRHRESGTLFITDIIIVGSHPCYNRLHTGLFISVLKDAHQRTLWILQKRFPKYDITKDVIPRGSNLEVVDSQGFAPVLTPEDYASRLKKVEQPTRRRLCFTTFTSPDQAAPGAIDSTAHGPSVFPTQFPSIPQLVPTPHASDTYHPPTRSQHSSSTPSTLPPTAHPSEQFGVPRPLNTVLYPLPTIPQYPDVSASTSLSPIRRSARLSRQASEEKRSRAHTSYSPYTTRLTQRPR